MGGAWDATNLIAGDVTVITPVALDHPELGDTVIQVAGEKAGIIKEGMVSVCREQEADALEVIERRCESVGAQLLLEFRDWEVEERLHALGGQSLRVRGTRETYDDLFLPLFGEHAARNAAAAIVAVEQLLGEPLEQDAVREALAAVRWPGRMEVVQRRPAVMLDGAHNPAAAQALADALRESFTWDRLHLVMSVSANKNLGGIVAELAPLADVVYAARNRSDRSEDPAPVAARFAAEHKAVTMHDSVVEALDAARSDAGPGDLILVTGSLYTVADARRALVTP
jgi:dihydrofolate synthase/folylpolyglutamate synthase